MTTKTPLIFRDIERLLRYIHEHRNLCHPRQFIITFFCLNATLLEMLGRNRALQRHDGYNGIYSFLAEDVEDIQGLMDVFSAPREAHLKSIDWSNTNAEKVFIDIERSKVYLTTDSLSFTEMCRHRLQGTNVKKFLVDLKIRPAAVEQSA